MEHGTVVGRWFDSEPVPPGANLQRFTRDNPLQRPTGRLRNTPPEPVITTRSLSGVLRLLDSGWSVQQQALLILDAHPSVSPDGVLHTFGTEWNWTASPLPPPALALIAPGNDGDCILLAAPTQAPPRSNP